MWKGSRGSSERPIPYVYTLAANELYEATSSRVSKPPVRDENRQVRESGVGESYRGSSCGDRAEWEWRASM